MAASQTTKNNKALSAAARTGGASRRQGDTGGTLLLHPVTLLGQVLDLSGMAKVTSLLVLPFAHEDLAIVLGGYLITNDLMSVSLVAASIYGGIVASDFALYGLGAAARYVPLLNRFAIDSRVIRFSENLKRNIFVLVALCRFVPGVVFAAFIACGWVRVSLFRFAAASLIISALYLPLMLYLVIVFGDAMDDRLGLFAWPILLVLLGAVSVVRKRIFAFPEAETAAAAIAPLPHSSFGMPQLSRADRKVAAAERIPPLLFYLPLALNWIRLALRYRSLTLPTAVNPTILTGGMWGETKSSYFADLAPDQRRWIADFVVVERHADPYLIGADVDNARRAMTEAGLAFPVIAKPDIGWHGHGVRRIGCSAALEKYIAQFPPAVPIMLQRYVPYEAEAAVLYARRPGEATGRILSLTFRYFPHVVGDGHSTIQELIESDPRAQWKSSFHLGGDSAPLRSRLPATLIASRHGARWCASRSSAINAPVRCIATANDTSPRRSSALRRHCPGMTRIPLWPLRPALRDYRRADARRGFLDRRNQRHRR